MATRNSRTGRFTGNPEQTLQKLEEFRRAKDGRRVTKREIEYRFAVREKRSLTSVRKDPKITELKNEWTKKAKLTPERKREKAEVGQQIGYLRFINGHWEYVG